MKRLPPVPQVLVRTIPPTGRKSLDVASHAGRIFGMPDDEGRALIDELIAHTTRRQFVYTHRWRPHELVMWDNRCTMHRGTDYDDLRWVRDMQRVTISDVANSWSRKVSLWPPDRWRHDAAATAGLLSSGSSAMPRCLAAPASRAVARSLAFAPRLHYRAATPFDISAGVSTLEFVRAGA